MKMKKWNEGEEDYPRAEKKENEVEKVVNATKSKKRRNWTLNKWISQVMKAAKGYITKNYTNIYR